jgi:hypothetical protein
LYVPSIGKNGRQLRDGLLLMAEEAPLPVNLLRVLILSSYES